MPAERFNSVPIEPGIDAGIDFDGGRVFTIEPAFLGTLPPIGEPFVLGILTSLEPVVTGSGIGDIGDG